ncbi:hypothetical protein, partial [Kitasatospora albolonga]|uniref:hypothetical protein n=1 Tax=Kitasatospora albolonga TaxID=68173 RepID=UPI0035EF6F3A
LALTFGTLLSSQGTVASFGLLSSRPSGRFVLSCFPAYQKNFGRFTGFIRSEFPLGGIRRSARAPFGAHRLGLALS